MGERHRIETRVGRLAVRVVGDGPTAVLWPSLFMDERSWDRLLPSLTQDRRLVIINGPGHGASGDPGHRCSESDQAATLRRPVGGEPQTDMSSPGVAHPVNGTADHQPIQNLPGCGHAVVEAVSAARIATGAMAGAVDDHQAAIPCQGGEESVPGPLIHEKARPQHGRWAVSDHVHHKPSDLCLNRVSFLHDPSS